uniref:Uncharacterized protein n=1 Tax=Romanomermis culicivorax TaxID=13658 RepID=A0A915KUA5_ROMCU
MLVRHLKKRKGGAGSDIVIINMNDQAPKRCQKIFGGAAVRSPGSRTASNSLDEGGEFVYDEDDRSDLYDHDQQQGQR